MPDSDALACELHRRVTLSSLPTPFFSRMSEKPVLPSAYQTDRRLRSHAGSDIA